MEIWKDVEGYEGIYQVSTYGRVKSLAREVTDLFGAKMIEERIIGHCESSKYYTVSLYKNNAGESTSVHRLVAKTFIPNPENKPCVNHIDGNKHNNHVENLEWVTYSENILHAYATGLVKPVQKRLERRDGVLRVRPRIVKYDSSLNPVAFYETKKEAEDANGIHGLCVGIARAHNGFYYAEEGDPMNTRQWDRVRGKKIPV